MKTLFIGKNLLFLHEVESTNTYAMNLLRNVNTIEGTVIYTDSQTKGKGQRGALWNSEIAQNITTSIILKPQFLGIENAFFLSKISALAVYDVLADILSDSQYDIKIKWPNDILVNRKKIAGILIENNFNHTTIQHSIIGIGLNVNQTEFSKFYTMATSLNMLTNTIYDRNTLLEKLCEKLEKWYLRLKEQKLDFINEAYLNCLFGLNHTLSFIDVKENVFDAKILGVSFNGKLIVELPDNSIKEYDIKDVKFIL